ncbi:MAG: helicase-related protein [Hyphomicrobiaceae bacterium]
MAELIRRQLGGAAVVLGALSPRTRNAQVALYQSGDVDYLVSTDAIGMGLNLDVDHVAFASVRKFDGHVTRNLTPGELGQIAGRAGRHMNDGTFGVTSDAEPFDADMIERLEQHSFDTVRTLQWRNPRLDFATLERLRESLRESPREQRLQRVRMADDVTALEAVSADSAVASRASSPAAVAKLWEVCQVPDYRKISSQNHAELIARLYGYLMGPEERIPEDWFAEQVARADRTDGDIDTLATRIAHIRTWTFVSNRADWLNDPVHWQERTRAIEDSLSDALHEQLALRFVDKRTSALMKGLRDKEDLVADIAADGSVTVASHYVGRLKGFRFQPDSEADTTGIQGKASRGAAAHVLSKEFSMRARRVAAARPDAFKLGRNARILWRDEEIARLEPSDDPLKPTVSLIADDYLSGPDKEKVQQRLESWLTEIVQERLKPLVELKAADDISGLARGIAFRLTESFGTLKRDSVADEMKQLDQPARAQLRKYGVRFGAFNIFLPLLLKPAPAELTLALWTLKEGAANGLSLDALPEPPRAGLTSVVVSEAVPEAYYRAAGYHVCGPRAIRVDMLERLADSIRPLLAWRPSEDRISPPRGSSGDGGFMVTPEMMSILGCSAAELSSVLTALGFRSETKTMPKQRPVAPTVAVDAHADAATDADAASLALAAAVALASPPAANLAVADTAAAPSPAPEEPATTLAPASDAEGTATASQIAASSELASSDADVVTVEVWRPRRRFRDDRRPRHHDRRPSGQVDASGEARTGERSNQRNRRHRGRGRDQARDAKPAETTNAAAPAAASPAAEGAGRPDDRAPRRDDRQAGQGRDRQRNGGGGGRDHRRDDRRRDENRRDDHRRRDDRHNRPQTRTAAPQRKGGSIRIHPLRR